MDEDRHQLSAWPRLDLAKLATLRAVVALGSFSAAGRELALTQPAVSRQIALLERQIGTQLVWRTRQGVHPTQAGQLLADHADAILTRLALAEEQVAEVAGLRRGRVRLGSFFSALVYLSAEAGAVLGQRHPEVVIVDALVDRGAALRGLSTGALDVAIVCEHDFEPEAVPAEIELVALFDDSGLRPASRGPSTRRAQDARARRPRRRDVGARPRRLRGTPRRPRPRARPRRPPTVLAGHGDEPVEAQALVAARSGIALTHELTVIVDRDRVIARRLDRAPRRRIQAAIMRGQQAPAALALLDALREVGRARAGQAASRSKARTAS